MWPFNRQQYKHPYHSRVQSEVPWTPPVPAPQTKTCGHDCELSVPKCCSCSDRRSQQAGYKKYTDGVGNTNTASRSEYYCPTCKQWPDREESTQEQHEPRSRKPQRQVPPPPPPPQKSQRYAPPERRQPAVSPDLMPLLDMGFSAEMISRAKRRLPAGQQRKDIDAVLEVLLSGAVSVEPLPPVIAPNHSERAAPPSAEVAPRLLSREDDYLETHEDEHDEEDVVIKPAQSPLPAAQSPVPFTKEPAIGSISESGTVMGVCVICCDRAINALIYPCGHLGFCLPCANDTVRKSKLCPICRKAVISVVQVFPV